MQHNVGATIDATNMTNAGNFINDGTITLTNITNSSTINNTGTINFVDFTNTSTGAFGNDFSISVLNGTDFLNMGVTTNEGTVTVTDFASTGTSFTNQKTMNVSNNFYTTGDFFNTAAGTIYIGVNFYNGDTANTSQAAFMNDGLVEVGLDFANTDTIKGTGYFCVANNSFNSGFMQGTFDFCDTTGGGTVDLNTGTIDNSITYCADTNSCFSVNPVGVVEIDGNLELTVYPNPTSGMATVEMATTRPSPVTVGVYNTLGQKLFQQVYNNQNNIVLDMSPYAPGIYILEVLDNQTTIDRVRIVVK